MFSTDRSSGALANKLRVLGMRIWCEAIERFADQDLDLLRLASDGAYAHAADGMEQGSQVDPEDVVEAVVLNEAIEECIRMREQSDYVLSISAFASYLDHIVLWILSLKDFK